MGRNNTKKNMQEFFQPQYPTIITNKSFTINFKYIDIKSRTKSLEQKDEIKKQQYDTNVVNAYTIPYLPDDIILHILYKLPHRSQIVYQCVSKHWLDLISNPTRPDSCIIRSLREYFLSPSLFGFIYRIDSFEFLPFEPSTYDVDMMDDRMKLEKNLYSINKRYKLEASSCGVLLFSCDFNNQRDFVIFNPFTCQTVVIPKPKDYRFSYCIPGFRCHVDLDDTSSNVAHYTVLILNLDDSRNGIVNLKIYGSINNIDGCWRNESIDLKFPVELSKWTYYQLIGEINGVNYWLLSYKNLIACDLNGDKLTATYSTLPFVNMWYHIMCVFDKRFYYCGLVKEGDSSWYLELFYSKQNPKSEEEFDWQSERSRILNYPRVELVGFNPNNPRLIFFMISNGDYPYIDYLISYDFKKKQARSLNCNFRRNYTSRLFPYERLPWPIYLHC